MNIANDILEQKITLNVKLPRGAVEALVCSREMRNSYETNRAIKTWSAFFVLKSLTTSGKLGDWQEQSEHLEAVLQCNHNTLRQRLGEMKALKLIKFTDSTNRKKNIHFASWQTIANILNISEDATFEEIEYCPAAQRGCQVFAHLMRVREIQNAQATQLNGLMYHMNKNPLLKEALNVEIDREFGTLPKNGVEFQQHLLNLQKRSFKEGSATYDIIHLRRADINRSVYTIQIHHAYKGLASVSYMKNKLKTLGLVTITHCVIESKERNRLHYDAGVQGVGRLGRKDAYKYNKKSKSTLMVLCDDIKPVKKNENAAPETAII